MTDVLYIVRPSGWNYDEELRYALRSLEKHARNIGRVFVCGDIPEFLSDDVVKISCDNPHNRKAKNLQYRLEYAIQHSDIGNRFLLSSDDIFLMQDVDLDNYPHFWKNGAEISVPAELENTKIGHIVANAREVLKQFGCTMQDFGGGHCLHWIYKNLWQQNAEMRAAAMNSKYGVPVDLMSGAMIAKELHPVHIIRTDLKFNYIPTDDELRAADCFSTGDRPDLWNGDKWLNELYPNKSRYEK